MSDLIEVCSGCGVKRGVHDEYCDEPVQAPGDTVAFVEGPVVCGAWVMVPPLPVIPPAPTYEPSLLTMNDWDASLPDPKAWVTACTEPEFPWTEEQLVALNAVDDWIGSGDPFFSLTGAAGTGKTTLVKEIVKRWGRHVILTAMTGKAALRLGQVVGEAAATLHATLYFPPRPGEDLRFARLRPPPEDGGIVVIDECFDYKQPILTEEGWQSIGKVVCNKLPVRVWSRNPSTGNLELKPIVRWLKKQATERLLSIDAGRTGSKRDGRCIKCTPSHKIMTPQGYVRAGDLRAGDEVVVRGYGLTKEQRSILIGSLLGDGSVTKKGNTRNSAQVKLMHGEEQLDYLNFKRKVFGSLASHLSSYQSGFENGKPVWSFTLDVTDDATRIADEMPYNGKKYRSGRQQWSPTDLFLSWIDEQALAIWFLDNGSRLTRELADGSFSNYSSIHTERFNEETHNRFVKMFADRFGIEAKIQHARGEMMHLRFVKEATEKLLEIVQRYTPSCMAWKAGKGVYEYEIDRQPNTTTAAIRKIEQRKLRNNGLPPVYDIEIADFHNYVAGNIVVSNCSMMAPSVWAHLKQWVSGARCLFVGDEYQLPAVITGQEQKEFGEDWTVFGEVDGAKLETVMRNAGGVLRAATEVRETGEICTESDMDGPGEGYTYSRARMEDAVDEYVAEPDEHLLITWRNETRMKMNRLIREKTGHDGPLPDEGEPVLFKRNGQGHLNGEIVICGGFEAGPMLDTIRTAWMKVGEFERILVTVDGGNPERGGEFFDGQQPWVTDWKRYHVALSKSKLPEPLPITWGMCLTAHSAQGGQARRTTVYLGREDVRSRNFRKPTKLPSGKEVPFSARFIYTAITRSTHYTKMIVGR